MAVFANPPKPIRTFLFGARATATAPPCDCRASAARCVSLYFSSIVHQTHSIRNIWRAALGSNIDKNFKFKKNMTSHEYVFWNFGGWVWAQRLNTHPFYNDLDLKQILALEHVGT